MSRCQTWSSRVAVVLFALAVLPACTPKPENDAHLTPVRIGWQIPLATQGQIAEVLRRTNILETNGLRGTFIPFSYGGPQTEAALAGQLDVIFVGDQPVINLIARGGKWKIVSRLFYTRTAIMVPPDSPIQSVKDLRDQTVASPFGTVAHREVTLKEQAAGLDPDNDVYNINLDILEISNVVQAGGEKSWGKIDAVGVWEPSTSLFELKKLARVIDAARTLGVIAASEEFITERPEATVRFLVATLQAWGYFATYTDRVNQWYIEDARLAYTPAVLESAARVEPNYAAKSLADINLNLTPEHIATLEEGATWSLERGFAKNKAPIRQAVDASLLMRATDALRSSSFDPAKVRVHE